MIKCNVAPSGQIVGKLIGNLPIYALGEFGEKFSPHSMLQFCKLGSQEGDRVYLGYQIR